MKHIFYLSGDFIDLGKEEVLSLFDIDESKLLNNLLITNLSGNSKSWNNIFSRLALTKYIYRFLFECKTDELSKFIKNFDWNSVYKGSFCLRINDFDKNPINEKNIKKDSIKIKNNKINKNKKLKIKNFSEKNLAGYIWNSVKNPKVDLENPTTRIEMFFIGNKVYCGLLLKETKGNFEKRKSHLRPFPHPSSLHPKLARALINISGIKKGEVLLDPFCGTGGFLIEAGLMNIKCIGYDINKIMIDGCKKNLKHYKIRNYKIKKQNAISIKDKFDYIVTDLPYGLNSNVILKYEKDWKKHRINKKIQEKDFIKNLENFYLKFLKNLRKKLKPENNQKNKVFLVRRNAKRFSRIKNFFGHENSKNFRWKKAVIVFPSYVNYKKLLKIAKFKIEEEFEQYIHRSLRRKIVRIKCV